MIEYIEWMLDDNGQNSIAQISTLIVYEILLSATASIGMVWLANANKV